MAQNAHTTFNQPQSSAPYQVTRTSTNQNTNLNTNSHSSYTIDPLKQSAAAWASQAVAGSRDNGYNVDPPPPYYPNETQRQAGWDQSFVYDSASTANPAPKDPANPFQ